MRIFIIDDEKIITSSINKRLLESGYKTTIFRSVKDFLNFIGDKNCNMYIVDIGLKDGDGFEIIKHIRQDLQILSPIIVLSGYIYTNYKVKSLNLGADDYIEKPFSLDELIARIQALQRRGTKNMGNVLKYNNISFDTLNRELTINGKKVNLTRKEKQIAEYFLLNIGRLISKEELVRSIWNVAGNNTISENNINVNLSNVRKKLGDTFYLETVSGQGYILYEKK